MNKILKYFAAVLLIALMTLPQSVFAFTNGEWVTVEGYEERKEYDIDLGELCKHLDYLYEVLFTPSYIQFKDNPFAQVSLAASPQIIKAYSYGIITEEQSQTFDISKPVLRGDVAMMMYALLKNDENLELGIKTEDFSFSDTIAPDLQEAVAFCVSRGFMEPDDYGKMRLSKTVTLADTMAIIDVAKKAAPAFAVTRVSYDHVTQAKAKEDPNAKRAYLTFDDGVSYNTTTILNALDKYGVKASFFITGTKGDEALIKRIAEGGHTIGSHSISHDYSNIYSNSKNFWDEIDGEAQYLERVTGQKITCFRFPGGSNNTVNRHYNSGNLMQTVMNESKTKGYTYFDWNVSSGDASGKKVSAQQITNNVLNGSKGKKDVVILMHQIGGKDSTAAAIPAIIEGLQAMGYEILPLGEDSFCPQFISPTN